MTKTNAYNILCKYDNCQAPGLQQGCGSFCCNCPQALQLLTKPPSHLNLGPPSMHILPHLYLIRSRDQVRYTILKKSFCKRKRCIQLFIYSLLYILSQANHIKVITINSILKAVYILTRVKLVRFTQNQNKKSKEQFLPKSYQCGQRPQNQLNQFTLSSNTNTEHTS